MRSRGRSIVEIGACEFFVLKGQALFSPHMVAVPEEPAKGLSL